MEILTWIHILITVAVVTSTRTKLSRNKLKRASSVELKLLNAYLRRNRLADIQDKSGSYAKNIRITDVDVPKVSFSQTRSGFLVSASNIGLSMKGDFRIKQKISWGQKYLQTVWKIQSYNTESSLQNTYLVRCIMAVSFIDGRKRDTNRKLYRIIKRVQDPIPDIVDRRKVLKADRTKCRESTGIIQLRFVKAKLVGLIANLFPEKIGKFLEKKMSGKICDTVAKTIKRSAAKLSRILKG